MRVGERSETAMEVNEANEMRLRIEARNEAKKVPEVPNEEMLRIPDHPVLLKNTSEMIAGEIN